MLNLEKTVNEMKHVIDTLFDMVEEHEKVIREQGKKIEELTEQMNKLLENA